MYRETISANPTFHRFIPKWWLFDFDYVWNFAGKVVIVIWFNGDCVSPSLSVCIHIYALGKNSSFPSFTWYTDEGKTMQTLNPLKTSAMKWPNDSLFFMKSMRITNTYTEWMKMRNIKKYFKRLRCKREQRRMRWKWKASFMRHCIIFFMFNEN